MNTTTTSQNEIHTAAELKAKLDEYIRLTIKGGEALNEARQIAYQISDLFYGDQEIEFLVDFIWTETFRGLEFLLKGKKAQHAGCELAVAVAVSKIVSYFEMASTEA